MKTTYEILTISCGQESINLITTSTKTARSAYRRITKSDGYCRIRVNGQIMPIADSDHWSWRISKGRHLVQGRERAVCGDR